MEDVKGPKLEQVESESRGKQTSTANACCSQQGLCRRYGFYLFPVSALIASVILVSLAFKLVGLEFLLDSAFCSWFCRYSTAWSETLSGPGCLSRNKTKVIAIVISGSQRNQLWWTLQKNRYNVYNSSAGNWRQWKLPRWLWFSLSQYDIRTVRVAKSILVIFIVGEP